MAPLFAEQSLVPAGASSISGAASSSSRAFAASCSGSASSSSRAFTTSFGGKRNAIIELDSSPDKAPKKGAASFDLEEDLFDNIEE